MARGCKSTWEDTSSTVQLTELGVQPGDSCLLAVMTDNSDDKNFPPGKRQYTLDFAYHGGIYRDVWMISAPDIHFANGE